MRVRRAPAPLSFNDAGRAARLLAALPDTEEGALEAIAWAAVNLWEAVGNEPGCPVSLSLTVTWAAEEWCETATPAIRVAGRDVWRALSHLASALACAGGDPTGGATHFHHGRTAPDWALDKDPRWIGKWAFYGGVAYPQKLEARGVAPAGFPP